MTCGTASLPLLYPPDGATRLDFDQGDPMSLRITQDDEMTRAELLPQADASLLVDAWELEARVKEMYGQVAREENAELHFEVGRHLAEQLGYPRELLDVIPG